jgi:hypothetical protein
MGIAQIANVISDPSTLMDMFAPSPILIGDLEIDVLLEESPMFDYDVTDHPVEAGLDISDSRIARPIGVILDCVLTDEAFDPMSVIGGALTGSLSFDTWQDKKAELYKLKDTSQVLNVATPLDTYYNMMITSIMPSITKSTSGGFFFRIELKEIRIVSTAIADIDPSMLPPDLQNQAKDTAKKAGKKKAKGAQKAGKAGTGKSSSILKKLVDGIGGMFG